MITLINETINNLIATGTVMTVVGMGVSLAFGVTALRMYRMIVG